MVIAKDVDLRYEPFDPECRAAMFEWYERLREQAPVYRAASGYWVISRYTDVREVLLSPDRFSSRPNQDEGTGVPADFDPTSAPELMERMLTLLAGMPVDVSELMSARMLVAADPPDHTRLRNLVNQAFTTKRVADLAGTIQSVVQESLRCLATEEPFDLMECIANPLPTRVMAELLSVDSEHYTDLKLWSDQMALAAQSNVRGTLEGQAIMLELLSGFSNYFVPLINARREKPTGDLLSALVQAEDQGSLSTTEVLLFVFVLMAAGTESTANLIGSMVIALLENPDQLELLQSRPELIPVAVEEAIRYRTPFQFFFREALVDTEIAGVPIPVGAILTPVIGSANHDPRQFDRPERFEVERKNVNTHLGFGLGIHHCLGMHLGRLEIRTLMSALVPQLHRFEIAEIGPLVDGYLLYGHKHLHLAAR